MTTLRKTIILSCLLLICKFASAGPPFLTDDPDPVPFRHWEYYLSSQNTFSQSSGISTGTLPHVEINYGIVPNMQVHLLMPLNYTYSDSRFNAWGYANTEMGIKYRFVKETDKIPEIGMFPLIEIPTIKNRQLSSGRTQVYIPVWIQKSWNKLTSYGGAGYWFNPGNGNKNWLFAGWQAQYYFSKFLTLGTEIYYNTAASN